jgi:hypothetical protein
LDSRSAGFDPLPDAVWEELPGGREARNEATGDTWLHLGSRKDGSGHLFMHAAHPEYEGELAFAQVIDRAGMAELAVFSIEVHGVDLGNDSSSNSET